MLLDIVKRLENQVKILENINSGKGTSNIQQLESNNQVVSKPVVNRAYTDFWNKTKISLMDMLTNAKKSANLSEDLTNFTLVAIEGICLHQDLLEAQFDYPAPSDDVIRSIQTEFMKIAKKLSVNKPELNGHREAINYGLSSLIWITLKESTADVAQQYSDMIDNHRNKIFMKKMEEETAWVKAWKEIFVNLLKLVKMEYKTGLFWNHKSTNKVDDLLTKLGNNYKNFLKNNNFEYSLETVENKTTEVTPKTPVNTNKKTEVLFNQGVQLINKLTSLNSQIEVAGFSDLNNILIRGLKFLLSAVSNSNKYKYVQDLKCLENFITDLLKPLKDINSNDLSYFKEYIQNVITSIHWLTKHDMCADIAQAYIDMADSPGNRILMKKIPEQSDWVKSIKEFNKTLLKTINEHFKFGLEFNQNGSDKIEDLASIDESLFTGGDSVSSQTQILISKEGKSETKSSISKISILLKGLNGGSIKLTEKIDGKIVINDSSNIRLEIDSSESVIIELENSKEVAVRFQDVEYKL